MHKFAFFRDDLSIGPTTVAIIILMPSPTKNGSTQLLNAPTKLTFI